MTSHVSRDGNFDVWDRVLLVAGSVCTAWARMQKWTTPSVLVQVRSKRVFPKVRTQKGIAIADYMQTLGHCQDTGENLEILEGGRKTSRERANSRRDENHSQFRHQTSLFPMISMQNLLETYAESSN